MVVYVEMAVGELVSSSVREETTSIYSPRGVRKAMRTIENH